jgi:hypothetical protein
MKKQRLSRIYTGCALKRAAGEVGDPQLEGWPRKSDKCDYSYVHKKSLFLYTSREKLISIFMCALD